MKLENLEYYLQGNPYWNLLNQEEKIILINNYLSNIKLDTILFGKDDEQSIPTILFNCYIYDTPTYDFSEYKDFEINYSLLLFLNKIRNYYYFYAEHTNQYTITETTNIVYSNFITNNTISDKYSNILTTVNSLISQPSILRFNKIDFEGKYLLSNLTIDAVYKDDLDSLVLTENIKPNFYKSDIEAPIILQTIQDSTYQNVIQPINQINNQLLEGLSEKVIEGITTTESNSSDNYQSYLEGE